MFDIDISLLPTKKRDYSETFTEEDVLMESLFEVSPKKKREDCRPLTPPETRSLRELIDTAFEEENYPLEPQVSQLPPTVVGHTELSVERATFKEMCKHAGILREYGGVKGFMSRDPRVSSDLHVDRCQ